VTAINVDSVWDFAVVISDETRDSVIVVAKSILRGSVKTEASAPAKAVAPAPANAVAPAPAKAGLSILVKKGV
jgi:hypothetical protein